MDLVCLGEHADTGKLEHGLSVCILLRLYLSGEVDLGLLARHGSISAVGP